jgi:UDP:flavonoid glycosyltransferase YjiC (YdhE family)
VVGKKRHWRSRFLWTRGECADWAKRAGNHHRDRVQFRHIEEAPMSARRHRGACSPASTTERNIFSHSFDRFALCAHSLFIDRDHHICRSPTEGHAVGKLQVGVRDFAIMPLCSEARTDIPFMRMHRCISWLGPWIDEEMRTVVRVLVSTTGGVGHILPVIPLALELRRQGHEVVWATAQGSCSVVERVGIATSPAGLMPAERAQRFSQNSPNAFAVPPRERRPVAFAGLFATTAGPVMMEALLPLFEEFKPDLVVHETSEHASSPIATWKDIPNVTVAFSGELPGPVLAAGVVAAARLWSRFGLDVPPDLGLYTHAYLHPFALPLGQRPLGSTIHDMQPCGVAGPSSDLPDWLESIGTERPFVYATFGTENGPQGPWSGPWRAIIGALASVDVDAVVTVGRSVDLDPLRAMVAELTPGRIRIESYIPQALLMGRAAVVISHAGAGTMLAAGVAGVPQIAMPVGADQFENTDAFVGAGAAVAIEDDEVDLSTIADQLKLLLEDSAFKGRSEVLARAFAEMPSPESIANRLTELVDD